MKTINNLFSGLKLGVFLTLLSFTMFAQKAPTSSDPEIYVTLKVQEEENQLLSVTGMVKNLEKETKKLRYELSVNVSNKETNNSSKNTQSGNFTLEPFETQNLSQTSVSTGAGSQSIIVLSIFKDATLLKKIKKTIPSQ